jgi:hypothetical protein
MKSIFVLCGLMFCAASFAQNIPFHHLGYSFKSQTNIANIDLVWTAPTNDLPRALWIYRALPSEVSPKVIANLKTLGSFTDKDRKEIPDSPRIISYANPSGKKTLLINPDWSFIQYKDSDADDMHITEGVPDKEQAFKIATKWLPKLGIDRSQLAKKPHSSDLQVNVGEETAILYKSRDGPAYATNISMREVFFMRSFDGVEISGGTGRGGCAIGIGNHARISQIFMSWRKYERDKSYPTATPQTLLKWIHEGKVVWRPSPDEFYPDWSSVKKMVITKVTPYYYSEGYSEYDKPQNWVAPFAELEAKIETDQTNSTIYLDCPIIDDTKPLKK